jgi:hemerythrin
MFNPFSHSSDSDPQDEFMPWSEGYEIGIKLIDDDHRNLFNIANHLYRSVKGHEGHKSVEVVFEMLTNYVQEHFEREEHLLEEVGYADSEEHKRLHRGFIKAFVATKESYYVLPMAFDFDAFLEFLKHWLEDHVMEQDRKYAPFVLNDPLWNITKDM